MSRSSDRVTIVDVARAAGTSVSSASVALRGEPGVSERTRIRVLPTADQLGYQPDQRARVLREQRSRLLGVTFAVDQTFDAEVVENLYRAAADTGYDLVLSATTAGRPEAEAVESLLRDRCPTLILISPALGTDQLVELSGRASVVTIGSDLRADRVDSVRSDEVAASAMPSTTSSGSGTASISYVDGGAAVLSSERRDGYLAAMAAHGLDAHSRVLAGHPTEESGVEAAHRILGRKPLPTAVLAHNDMIAFGLLLTLRANGDRRSRRQCRWSVTTTPGWPRCRRSA